MIFAQEQSEFQQRLNFFVGEWKSVSVNQKIGEESIGNSSVHWIMAGKWLQWKFIAQLKQGHLEVLTLINYHKEKNQYAFYSFNPIDDEPIPHYGNWLDENTLKIKTDFQCIEVRVDFKLKENGNFYQEHSRIHSSGEWIMTSRTKYSRLQKKFYLSLTRCS